MPGMSIPVLTRTDDTATITHATPEAVLAWLEQERYAAAVDRNIEVAQGRIGETNDRV